MTHLEKNISEMKEEIAALNLEIKRVNAQARLERARAKGRRASGKAALSLARATHERRTSRFTQLRDKALAKGYPLGRAIKYAKRNI